MERVKSAVPNCSLCHLEFDSYYHLPRVVPKCGHTFCEKCATKKVHLRANRKIFICPDCESEVVIRKTIAEELPVNSGIL